MKKCSNPKCKVKKRVFHSQGLTGDGTRNLCKECTNKRDRDKYRNDHEPVDTKQRIIDAYIELRDSGIPITGREIARKIGSKNTGVVNYHFGSLNQLIIEVESITADKIKQGDKL